MPPAMPACRVWMNSSNLVDEWPVVAWFERWWNWFMVVDKAEFIGNYYIFENLRASAGSISFTEKWYSLVLKLIFFIFYRHFVH